MVNLQPRYELITGANLTGSNGDLNRTYPLSYNNYHSVIEFKRGGAGLTESVDFTITNGVITFLTAVFDDQVISLRYFTGDSIGSISSGYGYCMTDDVYRTAGITSAEVSVDDVSNQILEAETIICRLTKNIYWKINLTSQTINNATSNTITKMGAGWIINDYVDQYIWIYSGTGSQQIRQIISNTSDTITVDRAWNINPDTDSLFKIFYVPRDFNPYRTDLLDGTGQSIMYVPYYPIKVIEQLLISEKEVTISNIYLTEKTGKLQLSSSAEVSRFSNTYPQEINIKYWYGIDHLPRDIKRLVELRTAINILVQQMGGTFDDPSTIGLPETNITIGQAYINIEGTIRRLQEEYNYLIKSLNIWPVFG